MNVLCPSFDGHKKHENAQKTPAILRKEIDGTESSNLEPALKIARGDLSHHKVGLVSSS